MIAIIAAISVSVAAGIWAERRYPDHAGLASRRSLSVVLYVVLPPVTFLNLAATDLDADHAGGIAIGWVATALAACAAWAIGARLLRLRRAQTGALISCTLIANTGYLGYPLVAALLGLDRLGEAVVFDVGVGTPALLIGGFAVGAAFGDRAGSGVKGRTGAFFARNVPLYAALLALIAPDALAPEALVDASRIVVVAVLPVGFFAVGSALAEDSGGGAVRLPPPLTGATAAVASTKLVLLPALLYLLSLPLIDLPSTYLLMAAMPSGLNSMVIAHAYGLDLQTAAEAVAWTTLIVVMVALVASLAPL